MKRKEYEEIRGHVRKKMRVDVVHDIHHVERVLFAALIIARDFDVDRDVLVAACLLHDIGRERGGDHAEIGAKMARKYLKKREWSDSKARHVRDCVRTHRFRSDKPPESMEAKILYDADKLDVTGAIGIARTLQYGGMHDLPLYALDESGRVDTAEKCSFVGEYHFKLIHVDKALFTPAAKAMASGRMLHMRAYYSALMQELSEDWYASAPPLEEKYAHIREYLWKKMRMDVPHDMHHVERVLRAARRIAESHEVDEDVLVAACLLHDVGRNRGGDHAEVGAKIAHKFLLKQGWSEEKAARVREAIAVHSIRAEEAALEAKILYDADKLDVRGALGVARMLQYGATLNEPLYALREDVGPDLDVQSFLRECHNRLDKTSLFTQEARTMAEERVEHSWAFYNTLLREIDEAYQPTEKLLEEYLY